MDIVEELRDSATRVLDGSGVMCEARMELLTAAADEIEHLRSVAGAVSQGPSLAEIRAKIDHAVAAGGALAQSVKATSHILSCSDEEIRTMYRQRFGDMTPPVLKAFDGA